MIRPAAFAYNMQTAGSNKFQRLDSIAHETIHARGLKEFDEAVETLRKNNIDVTVVEDTTKPLKPDAVFPNNWFSVHENAVVLYPMAAQNRRLERRADVVDNLLKQYPDKKLFDLTYFENEDKFLEGTGSLVLDRVNKIAFAALSQRTHRDVVNEWCRLMNYTPVLFHTHLDEEPVYHTNVLMAIGDNMAIVCSDAIVKEEIDLVERALIPHRQINRIKVDQMKSFAGNALLVETNTKNKRWVLSQTAYNSLSEPQRAALARDGEPLTLNLPTIETFGGGSARCMLAEMAW